MINKYDEALDRIVFNYGLSALDGETNDILDAKFNDDVKVIMSLIKKETPMKPYDDKYCPNDECGHEVARFDYYVNYKHDRCSKCGQKIDWSGINDAT